MLPQGYTPTSQGTGTGKHATEEEDDSEEDIPSSTASDEVRLDKSNIILLGPTGCGECVHRVI